jgi:hypothetical protein
VLVALAMGPCKCPGGEECKNPNLHSAYIARREGCPECPITRAVMRIAVNRGAAMAGYSNPTLEVPILFAPDRTTTTDEDCSLCS